MTIFLGVFIALYGSLHFLAFWTARRAFHFQKGVGVALGLFMGGMVVCPILVCVVERQGMESLCPWVGFYRIHLDGLPVSLCCVGIVPGYLSGSFFLVSLATGRRSINGKLSPKAIFFLCLGTALVLGVYAQIEAITIQTEHIVIKSPKIPKEVDRFRIVQISDVHLGLIMGKKQLSRILNVVRAAKPDILVSTGDLLDGQVDGIESLAEEFQEIKSPHGKYAINGWFRWVHAGFVGFLQDGGCFKKIGSPATVITTLSAAAASFWFRKPAMSRYCLPRGCSGTMPFPTSLLTIITD